MPLIKCTDCGQDVSTSAKTCPRCGAPIASAAAPQQQPQQPQPQQPQQKPQQPQVTVVQQAEQQPATKPSNQPKKKGSWWKFFLGLLLGLVLGALASYFLLAPSGQIENAQDTNDSTAVQTDSISHPVQNRKSAQEDKSHSKSSHKSSKEASKQKDDESDKPSEEQTGPDKSRKEIGTMMKDAKKRVDAKNLRDALGN